MKFLTVFLCLMLYSEFSKAESTFSYVILMHETRTAHETPSNHFTNMGLSGRKYLCQSVRNAQIFVHFHQYRDFIKWMKHAFPEVQAYNNKNLHQCTERDGDISFHQKFQNTELLRCDYGISEVYLTKVVNAKNYYMLHRKCYNSGMLFTIGCVVHILRTLPCFNHNEEDDFTVFKKTFQQRVQVLEPVQTSSGMIHLPTENSLLEDSSNYKLNKYEKSLFNQSKFEKFLLCASIFKNLAKMNEIYMVKSLQLTANTKSVIKRFQFLPGINIIVLQCIGRSAENETKHSIEMFIVPHPSIKKRVFAVYGSLDTNGERTLAIKQFFVSELN